MSSLSKDDEHVRPDGASDEAVAAVGKMTEALEKLERARGRLYDFHQLIGASDLMLDDAKKLLKGAGQPELAKELETELIGRNVLAGRWTFQVVEEFDDGYYADFQRFEKRIRDQLLAGRRHVFESEMKERRRTNGRANHESRP